MSQSSSLEPPSSAHVLLARTQGRSDAGSPAPLPEPRLCCELRHRMLLAQPLPMPCLGGFMPLCHHGAMSSWPGHSTQSSSCRTDTIPFASAQALLPAQQEGESSGTSQPARSDAHGCVHQSRHRGFDSSAGPESRGRSCGSLPPVSCSRWMWVISLSISVSPDEPAWLFPALSCLSSSAHSGSRAGKWECDRSLIPPALPPLAHPSTEQLLSSLFPS